jgi:hypothetical protein
MLFATALSTACGARTGLDAASVAEPAQSTGDASSPNHAQAPVGLACPGNAGVQAGAPWPTYGRCPDHSGATPVVGPNGAHSVAWTWTSTNALTPLGPVVAADGTLFVVDIVGVLTALAPDGSVRFSTRDPVVQGVTEGFISMTLGADGTVYVFNGSRLTAVRPDGSTAWLQDYPGSCVSGGATIGPDGSILFLGSCDSSYRLIAVSPDGMTRWVAELPPGDVPSSPPSVAPGGRIVLTVPVSVNVAPPWGASRLLAYDTPGSLAWQAGPFTGTNVGGAVVADDGTAVFADQTGLVAARADGTIAWQSSAPDESLQAILAVAPDGTVFAKDGADMLYSLKHDGTAGWRGGSNVGGSAIVDGDGTLFVGVSTSDGWGTAAYSQGGELLWRADGVGRPVAMAADGTLYGLAFHNGNLDAIVALRRN